MKSSVKYTLLTFSLLFLSLASGQEKNSEPVLYKVGSIEDGFYHKNGGGIVLSEPIPDDKALADGIYFRPIDGRPLSKEEELRIVSGYMRNRRYTSQARGGGGFGGGFGTGGGFGGGFGFGGSGGAGAAGFGGGFGNQGSSSAGGFGFESGFAGNQGGATGGFAGSQGSGAAGGSQGGGIGGFIGIQGGSTTGGFAGNQGSGATGGNQGGGIGGFGGIQGGSTTGGFAGNQGSGATGGSQGGGTGGSVGIQGGSTTGGFAGSQESGSGAGNVQFGFGRSFPSNAQATNGGLVAAGTFATGSQQSQGTGGSNAAGGLESGFKFSATSNTNGPITGINRSAQNGQIGSGLCPSASCNTQDTQSATVGGAVQLGVGSSGTGSPNNQVVTSSDKTLKSDNSGSGALSANVESGTGGAKVIGDGKSAIGGGLVINTVGANTGVNTGGRIKGSFQNTIVGSASQRGQISSSLAGSGTFTAGVGGTGSTLGGVGDGSLSAGSNNGAFAIGEGTGSREGQYSGDFGGGFGGGRIQGGIGGNFGASLFDGANLAFNAAVPMGNEFSGHKGYSFSHSTSFGPHTGHYKRR